MVNYLIWMEVKGLTMNITDTTAETAYAKSYITAKNQVLILYSHSVISSLFPVICAFCLAYVLWDIAIRISLIIWMLLVVAQSINRYVLLWKYSHTELGPENAVTWLNRFTVSVFISGVLWGIAGIFLIPYSNTVEFTLYNGLTMMIICGLVSGALISYSINFRVVFAYSFPSLVPAAFYLISLGDKYNSTLGGFILLYYFFICLSAYRMRLQFNDYLEMDHQQQELQYKYNHLKNVYTEFRKKMKR